MDAIAVVILTKYTDQKYLFEYHDGLDLTSLEFISEVI